MGRPPAVGGPGCVVGELLSWPDFYSRRRPRSAQAGAPGSRPGRWAKGCGLGIRGTGGGRGRMNLVPRCAPGGSGPRLGARPAPGSPRRSREPASAPPEAGRRAQFNPASREARREGPDRVLAHRGGRPLWVEGPLPRSVPSGLGAGFRNGGLRWPAAPGLGGSGGPVRGRLPRLVIFFPPVKRGGCDKPLASTGTDSGPRPASPLGRGDALYLGAEDVCLGRLATALRDSLRGPVAGGPAAGGGPCSAAGAVRPSRIAFFIRAVPPEPENSPPPPPLPWG
jgi:hypothetical protein